MYREYPTLTASHGTHPARALSFRTGRRNRPLPSSKNSHFQNETGRKTFLVKMSFICLEMTNHFHINSLGLRLVLKQRHEKRFTYSFSLFPQHTRMFNKPMWSLRLLVSITSNNISFDNPLLHKSKASPFQNVT